MIAPRSLLMVSCTGDWTDETPRVEYPAIRSVYDLFDAGEHVHMVQMHADHNYNKDSREAVYAWFGKWLLNENNSEKLREKDFTVEPEENVRVFPERLPSQAITKDQLVAYWKEQSEQQLGKLFPEQKNTLDTLRRQMEPALQNVLGAKSPCRKELMIQRQGVVKQPDVFVEHVVIGRVGVGDQIPGVLLVPSRRNDKGDGTVLVHEKGKSGWFDSQTGKPGELLQNLLKQGHTVFMPDVFMTGEYDTPFEKAKRDTNASHFLTYNQTETALRVQDILTALAYMQSRYEAGKINLVGAGDAGLWCLLAAPLAQSLDALVVDAAAFPSTDDSAYLKRLFVPGLRRAGDVRTAQALVSPISLLIHNTSGYFDTLWAKSAYQADHAQAHLKIQESPADAETVVAWLK